MRRIFYLVIGIAVGLAASSLMHRGQGSPPNHLRHPSVAEQELDRVLPTIDIATMPFDQAIGELGKLTSAQIVVDWDGLQKNGFDRKTPVSVHGTDVYLWQVLARLMSELRGQNDNFVAFDVADGRIAITPFVAGTMPPVFVRVYDIHDLVSTGTSSGPSTDILICPPPVSTPSWLYDRNDFTRMVEDTVAPESWRNAGGTAGTIACINGKMYVTQTWENHRLICKFLNDMRATETTPPPIVEKQWNDNAQTWLLPAVPPDLEGVMRKPIERLDLDAVPLDQAVNTLQKLTGVNIYVDWRRLDEVHVTRKVTLHVNGMPLSKAIELLLDQCGGTTPLGYTVDDGIRISTREETDRCILTRVYNVRDLLAKTEPADRASVLEDLEKLITETVASDSWRENGGQTGMMRDEAGQLIVSQTWVNHQKIADLLNGFRINGMTLSKIMQHNGGK